MPAAAMEALLARQRVLVVSPHADDETMGSGGLIAKVKAAGGEVYVLCFSVGDLDHFDGKQAGKVSGRTRADELAAAMRTLGVDDWEILFHSEEQHLRMDGIPRRDLVNLLEREARLATEKLRPTLLILPAPSFNQDHAALFEAGVTACRPHARAFKSFQQCVLVAEIPQLSWGSYRFHPNFFVDITGAALEKKLAAFACHQSQVRPDPHQSSIESLRLLALRRGRDIGVEAAEAYECLRFTL